VQDITTNLSILIIWMQNSSLCNYCKCKTHFSLEN